LKIGLFGFGKAGRAVATVILNDSPHELEWVVRKSKTLDHRSVPDFLGISSSGRGLIYSKDEFKNIENDDTLKVDAIIDFSSAKSIYEYGEYAAKNKITVVTAISKYMEKEIDYVKALGKKTRVLWSPNITVGINFLLIAAKVLQKIAPDADIQILEEHFKNKPEVSGTAKVIAKHLHQDEVNIKTIRAGGIVGKHEVLFGFPYQVVRLVHESISREAFGNGALFALQNIKNLSVFIQWRISLNRILAFS
jgi:4-hydroxy-tetrahydrodipicolinate reductase